MKTFKRILGYLGILGLFHWPRAVSIHRPWCACGLVGERNEKYDAYFCPASDVWLEDGCQDSKCNFCNKRPRLAPQRKE